MSDPTFGIGIQRVDNEPRPAAVSDMSVVGLIGPMPNANTTRFPLNTPVFVFSDDTTLATDIGSGGYILDALDGGNDQLGEFQVAQKAVLIRVADDADPLEVIENIVGDSVAKTGMHAFTEAGTLTGFIPRLLAAPGYTSQEPQGVETIAITSGGAYDVTPTIVISDGGGSGAEAEVTVFNGTITAVKVTKGGRGYTSTPTITITRGDGDTQTTDAVLAPTVATVANAVCQEFPGVCGKLLAHAVVAGPATTLQAYTDWRERLNSFRLIPVETSVKVGIDSSVMPPEGRVIGIGVRRDHEFGGRPFHSWANQAMNGIVGPNRPISFSLTDGATEGQAILEKNGGVIIRGEMGVESAIASGGFVYVGTDNCSEDPLWQFYNVTRGRDYIHLMLLKTLRFYIGKFNITVNAIDAVIRTMNFALRDLKADGDILGYEVGFDRDQNSPENIRLGKFTVKFAAEEAPVLRYLGIHSARYRPALEALLDDLLAQVDTVNG